MSTPIHQEVTLPATPQRVFQALVNPEQFGALTGAPAEAEAAPGGAFSLFGGRVTGRTVESVPGQRLVQAWRVITWAPGVYSVVRFELQGQGKHTRVVLDQDGFPEENRGGLDEGWPKMYWEPLRKYLG